MSVERKRRRKSMSLTGSVIGKPTESWLVNQERLITKSRESIPFPGVIWEESNWDVSVAYEHRTRGYKTDRPVQRIFFTQHAPKARVDGAPLSGAFGEVVKSLVCARHCQRGQTASSHMIFIRGTRYVFDALAHANHDISTLTGDDLDAASDALFKREAESSAYKVIGHIEEFADALDCNGICRIRLDWRCRRKKRPESMSHDRIEDAAPTAVANERLPKEEVIRAVGYLYLTIPSCASPYDPVSADRIMVLVATILVCTGLRIGEGLTLPAKAIIEAEDGSKCIRYARLKGRGDDVIVEWRTKPLLTATVTLVEDAVSELEGATRGAREVARLFLESGELLHSDSLKPELDVNDLIKVLGLKSRSVAQFLRYRKIPFYVIGRKLHVTRGALREGLKSDHWLYPMIPGSPKQRLELHDALCVTYAHQMHRGTKTTLMHAAKPISDQSARDFLTGRTGTANIFERYQIVDDDGQKIDAKSHGFRHFLNNLLDEGGAPDLVQTKWFGRKHAADTKAYQHLTYAQRASRVVAGILDGGIRGRIVDTVKVLPVEVARTFLEARIHAIHDVGPGMCFHDFQMVPCGRHLQCTCDCDEYIWVKEDQERAGDLKRQAASAYINLRTVQKREQNGGLVQPEWRGHLQIKYEQLMTQLSTLDFYEADLVRYIEEGHSDGQNDSGELEDQ